MRRSIKHVLFLEPKSSHLHVYSDAYIPRIGSLMLATILRNKGYGIRVMLEEVERVDTAAFAESDVICISSLTSTAPGSYQYADFIRNVYPDKIVLMGGTHPTFMPEEALEHCDFVVCGEGEETLVELLECIQAGADFRNIPNLSWKENGRVFSNPQRPKTEDLDVLPVPDFNLIPRGKMDIMSIQTQRGCPWDCSFCTVTKLNGHKLRGHSVERVLDMMETYLKHPDLVYLFFADDIFNVPVERTMAIMQGMIDRKLRIPWAAQMRHEVSKQPALLKKMREAGCDRIMVGFESIDETALELYGKKETARDVERAIDSIHEHGIDIHAMFIAGANSDRRETIEYQFDFARRKGLATSQCMILTYLPGADDTVRYNLQGGDYLSRDWSHYDGHHANHLHPNMTRFELVNTVMKGMQSMYSPGRITSKFIKAGVSLLKFDKREAARQLRNGLLRLNGHSILNRWFKEHVEYMHELRAENISLNPDRYKRVLLAVSNVDVRGVLHGFLTEMGVRVEVFSEEHLAGIRDSDLVVMANETVEEMRKRVQNLHIFPVYDKNTRMDRTLTQLGILFTENIDKVREAISTVRIQQAALTPASEG
ncbi:MAG: B12-binding domain-containing radical SAM protein [candidate division Zixibacteria bacterium]|nr:B12-binding domain-containing radical SAM protein [candidate division Zixibacteria bacterium]